MYDLQFLEPAGNTPVSITNRDGAAVARAVLGGNLSSEGEGENGDQAALNTSRAELLFAR